MASSWLSTLILLFLISCLSVLLLSNVGPLKYWDIRHEHLLPFILRKASPLDNRKDISNRTNLVAQRINDSVPWIHFYATSAQILENYFVHGHYQGGNKYHKRFTHGRLVILPFISDTDGRFRRCISQVSLQHEMAIKHHTSMLTRWQWESSNEGLASFRSKYKLFYGPASHGACLQTSKTNSEFGEKLNPKSSHLDIHFARDSQNGRQWPPHLDFDELSDSNCGQILLLQHPISRSIEEYRKSFMKEGSCVDIDGKLSNSKCVNRCADSDANEKDYEETLVSWIKNRGNVIFKHLLFHPHLCKGDFRFKRETQKESSSEFVADGRNHTIIHNNTNTNNTTTNTTTNYNNNNNGDKGNEIALGNMGYVDNATDTHGKHGLDRKSKRNIFKFDDESQCDKNVRIFFEGLDSDERSYLLSYVVKRLSSLFSLVALNEDLEKSLEMLDVVHHFPLRKCIFEEQNGELNSNWASSLKDKRNVISTSNKAYQAIENEIVLRDIKRELAKNIDFDKEIFELKEASESHNETGTAIQHQNVIFQDLKLKHEFNTDGREKDSMLSEKSVQNYSKPIKDMNESNGDENQSSNLIADIVAKRDCSTELDNFKPIQILNSKSGHRVKACNKVSDSQQLFLKLSSNEIVLKSLDMDLKIYNEVKKLYRIQKRMVFNTLKT